MEQARQRKKLQERRGARQKKRAKRATRAANAAQAPPSAGGAGSLMRETEDLRQQMTRLTPKVGPTAIDDAFTAQNAGSQALPSPVNPASLRYLGSQTQPAFPGADCEFV